MSDEFETGAAMSAGALSQPRAGQQRAGDKCRNCGSVIESRYCSDCGQLAQNFHRPIWHLVTEVCGDFLSLDGRVMQTLPSLMIRPGRVTKEYLGGQRQKFVPPFRLYLLTSFVFFLLLFAFGDSHGWFDLRYGTPSMDISIDEETGEITVDPGSVAQDPSNASLPPGGEAMEENAGSIDGPDAADSAVETRADDTEENQEAPWLREDGRVNRDRIDTSVCTGESADDEWCLGLKHFVNRVADAYENQGMFFANIQNWAPRLALGFTPVLILLLIILYPFYRRIYVYDHVITALHVQSWMYILLGIGLIFFWFGQNWFAFLLFGLPPIYFYRTFRVVYSSGRILSFLRTGLVLFGLTTALMILMLIRT